MAEAGSSAKRGPEVRANGLPAGPESDTLQACVRDDSGYPSRRFQTRLLPALGTLVERSASVSTASKALRTGHAVAFPTETVYGLGASALSSSAVLKIFAAKGRPADNPLIVHISDLPMLSSIVDPDWRPSEAYQALFKLWPAPMTLLCPAKKDLPREVTAGHSTVGVRIPQHELARELIRAAGVPLAAPSANASGRPSPTLAAHVISSRGRVPFILDGGPCTLGLESTVIDGITSTSELRILRPGGLSAESIQQCLGSADLSDKLEVKIYGQQSTGAKAMEFEEQMLLNPTTPGMKYRHYSPDARVVLIRATKSAGTRNPASTSSHLGALLEAQLERSGAAQGGDEAQVDIGVMSLDSSLLSTSIDALCVASRSTLTDSSSVPEAQRSHLRRPIALRTKVFIHRFSLGSIRDPHEAASRLFQGLRVLDETGCDVILVESVTEQGIGLAIMNRLNKAAGEVVEIDL
ncbi:translation factor [Ceraceosorus guamensis]|uniref:Threonylcarbamoyl-AMP synthase n=1 Tax=Ceraceosorus guamensis TaxID=1522189 RepID=A0A316W0N3_9BASI|nr:translation factor [Ceraceosorus guamensis]PWN42658.1 translation factor [Ceraceosorus guamensis]